MLTLQYQTSYTQAAGHGFKLLKTMAPFSLLAAILLGCFYTHPEPVRWFLSGFLPYPAAKGLVMLGCGILGVPVGALVGGMIGLTINWFFMRKKRKQPSVSVTLNFTDEGLKYQSCDSEFFYPWEVLGFVRKMNKGLMLQWQVPGHASCLMIPPTAFEQQNSDEFYSYAKERQKKQTP